MAAGISYSTVSRQAKTTKVGKAPKTRTKPGMPNQKAALPHHSSRWKPNAYGNQSA
jgi:hypothetical protein